MMRNIKKARLPVVVRLMSVRLVKFESFDGYTPACFKSESDGFGLKP